MADSFADFEGWKELQDYLKGLPSNIETRFLKKALTEAALVVEAAAKTSTDFEDKTGRLRKSIELEKKRNKKGIVRMGVKASAPHAHLIEKGFQVKTKTGTRHVPGKYFLTNALLQSRDQIVSVMRDVLGKEIARYEKKMLAKAKREAKRAAKVAK